MLTSHCSFPLYTAYRQGWAPITGKQIITEHLANNNQRAQGRDNEAELEIPQTHGASSVIKPVLGTQGDIL